MSETRYSLKLLKELMSKKTIATSRHRHVGTVLCCELAVTDTGAKLVYRAEFPKGETDSVVDEVVSVL